MLLNTSPDIFYETLVDRPIGFPECSSEEEAMRTPGCHLKSKERENGRNVHFGTLIKWTDSKLDEESLLNQFDIVVLDSNYYMGPDHNRVWTGTQEEYFAMWECD